MLNLRSVLIEWPVSVFSHEPVSLPCWVHDLICECVCVCVHSRLYFVCVCVSLPALFSSPFIRHFFVASFTTQLSRSNSRHKTRDSTLQLLSFWHAFPFHFIHFAKKRKNKYNKKSTFTQPSHFLFSAVVFSLCTFAFFLKNKQIINCTTKREMKTC